MADIVALHERRTTTDAVFHRLSDEIGSLKLLPGTKLSEVEVAKRFGVSRQPVRDAFNRLDNLGLLLIRPQKATQVRGFSMPSIAHARFIRLSVELEVIRRACACWSTDAAAIMADNLEAQRRAVEHDDTENLHALDYSFHRSICQIGGTPMAFETVQECKRKVDRLCTLSLTRPDELSAILDDHRMMADALAAGDEEQATVATRRHLARLDDTIVEIHRTHPEYFE